MKLHYLAKIPLHVLQISFLKVLNNCEKKKCLWKHFVIAVSPLCQYIEANISSIQSCKLKPLFPTSYSSRCNQNFWKLFMSDIQRITFFSLSLIWVFVKSLRVSDFVCIKYEKAGNAHSLHFLKALFDVRGGCCKGKHRKFLMKFNSGKEIVEWNA